MRQIETPDDDYTTACFLLEKKLGQHITPDYPAGKFVVQLEELKKYYDEQKKEMDRSKRGDTLR